MPATPKPAELALLMVCGALWLLPSVALAEPPKATGAKPDAPSLSVLVDEAMERHPRTSKAKAAVRARREIPSRMESLPDPVLMGSLQNVPFDDPRLNASAMTGVLFTLSQTLPYPGKLRRRGDVARADISVSEKELAATRLAVAFGVSRAYWRLHFAERAELITGESEHAINALANAVHARFSVAQAAQQDALQSQVAHSRVRALVERRRQAVRSAQRELLAAVGRSPTGDLGPTRGPPLVVAKLDRRKLARMAREKNPDLAVSSARERVSANRIREAKQDRLPDFMVSVGYRLRFAAKGDPTEGADMGVISFGGTLPIWSETKQSARVREERHRLDEARAATRSLALDVKTEVEQQVDAIERLGKEVGIHEKELIPEADQALDASIEDYVFAKVELVSVLQNWAAQLDARLEYERLLAERAERLDVLRALIGIKPGERLP
ncbi:MAG: TolC family protein [Myxococcales bacterium]|nr:TolC family protein [Myxococcales bacterium]